MIRFAGSWYDGHSSASLPAIARVDAAGRVTVIHLQGGGMISAAPIHNIDIPSRVGNTPRFLRFPCGGKFETDDHDGVEAVLALHRPGRWGRMIYHLESHLPLVFIALFFIVILGWSFVRFGVPAVARWTVYHLPAGIGELASRQTLKILDESVFSPSKLGEVEKREVLENCRPTLVAHSELNPSIEFRAGGMLKANAFALPSGTIVFTDEMIRISAHGDEIRAVLAHEIAHIHYRHGLRMLIQDSLLAFLLVFVTGDTAGTADILMGLPIVLTQRAYSRQFEDEADRFALAYLIRANIPSCRFSDLLDRIERQRRFEQVSEERKEAGNGKRRWTDYLSTHPDTELRLQKFRNPGCEGSDRLP